MANLTYDDYKMRLSIQDLLTDAGYVRNRRDGLRYPSYVMLDKEGKRIRGDKFIVTQNGQCCFQPPEQKSYNIVSFIKEHPNLFRDYEAGMNLDLLVNKVCSRLLNTTYEEKEREIREPARDVKPFSMDDYTIQHFMEKDRETQKPFYPYFKHRGIDLGTQYAFRHSFVLASRDSSEKKGVTYKNLSFLLTVPGKDDKVVGFEERGRSLGEHLAIHLDRGELQAVHEGGIVHAVGLAAGADTGDPKLTELALLLLAADVSIAQGLHDRLIGHLEVLGLAAPVTLGHAEDLISSLARHHRAFNSSHLSVLLICRESCA